jgi:predicted dehydrogenase
MTEDKPRFGIVGTGNSATMQVRDVRKQGRLEVGAVCDSDRKRLNQFAREWKIPKGDCYTDLSKMLGRDDLDFVVVSTPPYLHSKLGVQVAESRHHVVVEKPITTTLGDADELIRACDHNQVELFVISQHRYDNDVLEAHRVIPSLGKIISGEMIMRWFRSQAYYDSVDWRGTWDKDGGGALFNQGIHGLDILLNLCGNLNEVKAQAAIRAHENIEVEDYLHAQGLFASGAGAVIHATTCEFGNDETEIRVLGTNGRIVLRNYQFAPGSGIYGANGKLMGDFETEKAAVDSGIVGDPLAHGGHEKQLYYIAQELQGTPVDGIRMNRGEDGRRALEAAMGIYKSIQTGSTVRFPVDAEYIPDKAGMQIRLS